ncbi:glycosyltransferase family 4 protein [Motilibacter aurantiacus]|uniref:glycosyltransferase family 4 protein n=1 Tax=Motilibacter aurantiacus TaxID=2714955 RepID=UPI00140B0574|nr:glycosyltransferase family 4 protein [Motilibacter aurantiacus]NHC44708.1 glycosyltransferase family 4 protein [Motilibacter aurantiacus]
MGGADRPLRVLQLAARYLPDLGGIETHVHEVGKRLAARPGVDLTVAASDRTGSRPRLEQVEGFDVVRRRAWPAERDYYVAPGLAQVVRTGGWDVVHVQGVHTAVPPLGMLAALSARVPFVVTFHTGGNSSAARNAVRDAQWRAIAPLLRRADRLVAVSRFERRLFAKATGLDEERIAVVRNGGSLPEVPAGVRPVAGRVVSSGRLERYKGHHRVIAALPALRRLVPEAHVHVLGAGPYEPELRALAEQLGVAEAVEIRSVPPGDRGAMARSLAEASVFATFSDYEAHPVAVMEALTLGVPVVGTDIAGVADLVEDGLVDGIAPGATPEQAAGLLAAAMGKPRTSRQVDLPTWDTAADALERIYREVAAAPRRAPVLRKQNAANSSSVKASAADRAPDEEAA